MTSFELSIRVVVQQPWEGDLRLTLAGWPGQVTYGGRPPQARGSAAMQPILLLTDDARLGGSAACVWLGLGATQDELVAHRAAGADDVMLLPAPADVVLARLTVLGRLAEARACCHVAEDLLTALAHDARLPLFSLRGYAGLLRDGSLGLLGPDQARAVDSILGATARVERLLADGLDLARSHAGALAPAMAKVDLRVPLAAAVSTLEGLARAGTIAVETAGPSGPVWVKGDETRLERALANVVANAIQHSPGGGRVTVELSAGEGWATVVVSDQGKGLALEDRPHLFRRGYRTRSGSLVLGLSLVRELVELHGGAVEAGGEPGRGARFELRLPLAAG
ncbi:MAG: HAMP domain-containing histidine kinase [Armatimonadetes bacterium]|nr:HAMP domain-containing histidine kinase [Armatimonadota bacterium]